MINFKSPKILYFIVFLAFLIGGFLLYKNAQNSQNPAGNMEVQPPYSEISQGDQTGKTDDKTSEQPPEQPTAPENSITISLNGLPQNLKNLKFTDQYQKEYYEKAIKAEEGIQKDPKNYQNYNSAGLWWKGLGDISKTNRELYFNRAIEIYSFAGKLFESKKVYQPYQNLANVYIILGNYTKAEEAMKEAIRLASEVGELYIKLAELYKDYMNAPSQKIIDLYESALHQESYQPDVIYPAYAQYLCSIGKQQEALEKTKINCSNFE